VLGEKFNLETYLVGYEKENNKNKCCRGMNRHLLQADSTDVIKPNRYR
jgi:hypothetical protein